MVTLNQKVDAIVQHGLEAAVGRLNKRLSIGFLQLLLGVVTTLVRARARSSILGL